MIDFYLYILNTFAEWVDHNIAVSLDLALFTLVFVW